MKIRINPLTENMGGTIEVPGDKSITHRALILGSIAMGEMQISNYLNGSDCLATLKIMQQMGVHLEKTPSHIRLKGVGLYGLQAPPCVLDAENSGTTMRLLAGLLTAQKFNSVIIGDASLSQRPMGRIIKPLRRMGANITGLDMEFAPLSIEAVPHLHASEHHPPVASAQVKSAIMLAGLYCQGKTIINEVAISRDHSERMLELFGAQISHQGKRIELIGGLELQQQDIDVPGDFSTAAYFIALALCCSGSLNIHNVGLNPTRTGFLRAVQRMGARIQIMNQRLKSNELRADLYMVQSDLHPVEIDIEEIPTLIDEVPILAILASRADGISIIKGISELKVKESNRLNAIVEEFSKFGLEIWVEGDQLLIDGRVHKPCASLIGLNHYKDHRIAMSLAVLALISREKIELNDADIVDISCPQFWQLLTKVLPEGTLATEILAFPRRESLESAVNHP